MKQSIDLIKELNSLLQVNYKALDYYSNVTQYIHDTQLKNFFSQNIKRRQKIARELIKEIINRGENPAKVAFSQQQKQWKSTQPSIEELNHRKLLCYLLKGERSYCKNYNKLLQTKLLKNDPVENVLKNHKADVYLAVARLEQLVDSY